MNALTVEAMTIDFRPANKSSHSSLLAAQQKKGDVVISTTNGHFLRDPSLSNSIREGLEFEFAAEKFRVHPEIKDLGAAYLDFRRKTSPKLFNGPLVGWRGVFGHAILQHGSYFDHIQTDLLSKVDAEENNFYGSSLLGNEDGLYPSETSKLFSGIGSSVLAFTSDGCLLLGVQGARSVSSAGLLAPSGSGSLEPSDLRGVTKISDAAGAGAVRELGEEMNVESSEIEAVYFTSAGRWLEMGAKMEFFSNAFLSVSAEEILSRKIKEEEMEWTESVMALKLKGTISSFDPENPEDLLGLERSRISLPLAAALEGAADLCRHHPQIFPESLK